MWASLEIIFGVVPEAISAWKPEMAPQAIVMKTKGNTGPANTSPVPSTKRVTAGMCSGGATMTTARASTATVPSFRYVLR